MKKTMKLFAVLCGVALALFAACAHDSGSEPTKYTVTFDSNGGSDVAPQSVESGKRAIEPKDPTKDGVTFGGWYDGENPFSFAAAITSDITLTAKWIWVQYIKGGEVLTFYEDYTFEHRDENGTSKGTYERNGDNMIEATFTEGEKRGTTMKVDTSGETPSITEDGEKVDGFEQVENPENQNSQDGESNTDNDNNGDIGNGGTDTVSYVLGDIVTISNVKYLVVKSESSDEILQQSPENHYYSSPRADVYRTQVLTEYGVNTPYAILFNTETKKENPISNSYWDDEYLIICGGQKCWRVRYRWESGSGKIDETSFKNSLTADGLRQEYDPTCIIIANYNAVYGTDLSDKLEDFLKFEYTAQNKVLYDDSVWVEKVIRKDYVYVYIDGSGHERYQYELYDRIKGKAYEYYLTNPYGGTIAQFRVNFEDSARTIQQSYRLIVNGTGTINERAESSVYQNTLTIRDLKYGKDGGCNVDFSIRARVNGNYEESIDFDDLYEREESEYEDDGKGNDSWSSPSDDKDSSSGGSSSTGNVSDKGGDSVTNTKVYAATLVTKNEGVGKYVKVSDTTTSVNGIIVPTLITFAVPFADENAPLGKFTTVTFVPKAKDNYVIYVPKEGSKSDYEFIDNYKSGYGIFGEYSTTRPAS